MWCGWMDGLPSQNAPSTCAPSVRLGRRCLAKRLSFPGCPPQSCWCGRLMLVLVVVVVVGEAFRWHAACGVRACVERVDDGLRHAGGGRQPGGWMDERGLIPRYVRIRGLRHTRQAVDEEEHEEQEEQTGPVTRKKQCNFPPHPSSLPPSYSYSYSSPPSAGKHCHCFTSPSVGSLLPTTNYQRIQLLRYSSLLQ
ncbi:hypothetical protein BZA05DRAFT_32288 [Tricharina praecox]|uniref:uncharacterized protein n=1 Tax=Tricharina praecox TaxID=43433 RepID=UPI0022209840|nr:uncharacterized protein BZA05DRAFT_32288 [Tricharina praecox]KAI5853531.1 hypothetical protein BZA05DRAFT_32288 [Tricharina praecox]